MAKRILLSRTDSIGDVVVSLPLAGVIKKFMPDAWVGFIGKSYTQDVINCAHHVDQFINFDDLVKSGESDAIATLKSFNADAIVFVLPNFELAKLAKKAQITERIGVNRRLPHLWLLNSLVSFSRKNSDLHESQLNVKLLKPLIGVHSFATDELTQLSPFTPVSAANDLVKSWLTLDGKKVCLHPKSQGSALEWGVPNFSDLANLLAQNGAQVFITGTENEGQLIRNDFDFSNPRITDTTGKLTLDQLITFIDGCDTLVAASTGPLHIASALGIQAIGLFTPKRPMHPGRWAPIGANAIAVVYDENCKGCEKAKPVCNCIQEITPKRILNLIIG
jgi:ADP-heptose:LPS heptosyltransferase